MSKDDIHELEKLQELEELAELQLKKLREEEEEAPKDYYIVRKGASKFSCVDDIPDYYLVAKGHIPREFQPDRLEDYFEPMELGLEKEEIKKLDRCFEPLQEFPKEYIPPGVEVRSGDLTEWKGVDAIVHQCNCLTVKAHGLSAQIANKYPWADVYRYRRRAGIRNLAIPADRKEPGTIQILRNPGLDIIKNSKGEKFLVSKRPDMIVLYAQWDFGKGRPEYQRILNPHRDTPQQREQWFQQCLDELGQCGDFYQNFAFPYKIGCGLAGGNWDHYFSMIHDFTVKYNKHVTLVEPILDQVETRIS